MPHAGRAHPSQRTFSRGRILRERLCTCFAVVLVPWICSNGTTTRFCRAKKIARSAPRADFDFSQPNLRPTQPNTASVYLITMPLCAAPVHGRRLPAENRTRKCRKRAASARRSRTERRASRRPRTTRASRVRAPYARDQEPPRRADGELLILPIILAHVLFLRRRRRRGAVKTQASEPRTRCPRRTTSRARGRGPLRRAPPDRRGRSSGTAARRRRRCHDAAAAQAGRDAKRRRKRRRSASVAVAESERVAREFEALLGAASTSTCGRRTSGDREPRDRGTREALARHGHARAGALRLDRCRARHGVPRRGDAASACAKAAGGARRLRRGASSCARRRRDAGPLPLGGRRTFCRGLQFVGRSRGCERDGVGKRARRRRPRRPRRTGLASPCFIKPWSSRRPSNPTRARSR